MSNYFRLKELNISNMCEGKKCQVLNWNIDLDLISKQHNRAFSVLAVFQLFKNIVGKWSNLPNNTIKFLDWAKLKADNILNVAKEQYFSMIV